MATGHSNFTPASASLRTHGPGLGAVPGSAGTPNACAADAQDAGPATAGLPAVGARTARPDRKRQRYAWMYDDDDIWGADALECVPPVINGDDWRAPRM